MKGIDTSHWQGDRGLIQWDEVKRAGYDFAFMKCTQGTDFLDPMFKRDKKEARKAGLLCGFYHFAGNKNKQAQAPTDEADWFLENVGDIQYGEILILDWEINHHDPAGWCRVFLERVYEKIGFRPVFYTYEARILSTDWIEVVEANYGLWIAKYGANDGQMGKKPNCGKWSFWAIWQFTSKGNVPGIKGPVDLNYTDMDLKTLKKYGKPGPEEISGPVEIGYVDVNQKFLVWPIDKVYITQKFGENPAMYARYGMKGHNGIDFRTRFIDSPLGKRYVTAPQSGVITEIRDQGASGYGKYVRMECEKDKDGNEQHIFAHLKKAYVYIGQQIEQGDLIALTDNTGASTGSHLHWGYRPPGWKRIYDNGFKGYIDQINFIQP
jgi:GH25 family lysozyme M1 (1,4-beta-N-acetylmuramidase)